MADFVDNCCTEDENQQSFFDEIDVPLIIKTHNNGTLNARTICQNEQPGFDSNQKCDKLETARLKLILVIILCIIFMITEFVGGYFAKSLAIMADAAHLMSDCLTFLIGILAISLSKKPADKRMSFGYNRIEVIAAMFSIIVIWILTAILCFLAVQRIWYGDYEIEAKTMMIISIIGIVINVTMAFTLHGSLSISLNSHGHSHSSSNERLHVKVNGPKTNNQNDEVPSFFIEHSDRSNGTVVNSTTTPPSQQGPHEENNLNIRAAMIHILGDFIQSVGVFLASLIIQIYPQAKIADPLCTLLFSVVVVFTTIKIFRESVSIIIDSVPVSISVTNLKSDILRIDGVRSIHHLNVWNHTVDYTLMMVHLTIDEFSNGDEILKNTSDLAKTMYKIKHSTIQIERQSIQRVI